MSILPEPSPPSERLSKVRKLLAMNQAQVADSLGVMVSAISKWEKGQREIGLGNLGKLAEFLYVTREWLTFGTVNQSVCEKLKSTRMAYGKAAAFGEKLGVPVEFIQAIERCEIMPSEGFLDRVASTYGLNRYELREGRLPAVAATRSTGNDRTDYDLAYSGALEGFSDQDREILSLLKEDPGAREKIIALLRARREAREAADTLREVE